jgi:hypothetical protein
MIELVDVIWALGIILAVGVLVPEGWFGEE